MYDYLYKGRNIFINFDLNKYNSNKNRNNNNYKPFCLTNIEQCIPYNPTKQNI